MPRTKSRPSSSPLASCTPSCSVARTVGGILTAAAGGFLLLSHSHSHIFRSSGGVRGATAATGSGSQHRPWAVAEAEEWASQPARRATAVVGDGPIHIVFCTDDTDLRGLVVAITTALRHASNPARFKFHVVTSADAAPIIRSMLGVFLPTVAVDVRYNVFLQEHIANVTKFKRHTWTTMREERLYSSLNYASFFLPSFMGASSENGRLVAVEVQAERLVYLDTDVVVLGDLAELHDMDLGGHATAATWDCLWRYKDKFKKKWLKKRHIHPRSCMPQRAVAVIDVKKWQKEGLTKQMEVWMNYTRNISVLWHNPMAPSAWLIALNGSHYQTIDPAWSCSHLGRETMTLEEGYPLRHGGFDNQAFLDLGVSIDDNRGNTTPFVVTCTEEAKLLHFNGALKPWLVEAWRDEYRAPVCALPASYPVAEPTWVKTAQIYFAPKSFVPCHNLWSIHMTEELDCALKDVEREWAVDDRTWFNRNRISKKKKAELAAFAAQEQEKERLKEEKEKKEQDEKEKEKEKDSAAESTVE